MKILSLLWGFSLGGIGKCALTYDRLCEVSDIEMRTACIQLVNSNCDLASLGKIGATIIPIESRFDLSWVKKSIALIKQYNPDVLFVHGFNGPVIAKVLQWKLKRKLPFVCSYHGLYYPPKPFRKTLAKLFNSAMLRIYRKNVFGIVSVSEYSKRVLVKKDIPSDKIKVVHNALKNDVFDGKNENEIIEVAKKGIVIGTVTRLDPFKGLEFLLEAFAALKEKNNINLIIIGDGPHKQVLEQKCCELEISDRVLFAGYRSDVDVCLNDMDIFVLPSLFENHSIALLEAMRAGKAIIATDVGGNTESVRDGKEALIVPAEDKKALANALKTMIADSGLRERLAKAARQRFEAEFTEEVMLEKLADWFRSMELGKK